MPFDFPNIPTDGSQFTPVAGGPTYVWSAATGAWKLLQGGASVGLYTADTPPSNPVMGQLWLETDTWNLFAYFDSYWVQVEGPAVRPVALPRNRIVNGAMQISQENGDTALSTTSGYCADQWMHSISVSPGVMTFQRVQVPTPNGSENRVRMTVGTAKPSPGTFDSAYFVTIIEGVRVADFGWGTAQARQAVLRFGFKAPAGNWGVSIQNGGGRSYLAEIVITAGQANTDTVQTFVVPGDVAGTWATDTSSGLRVYICLVKGSGLSAGTVGIWQAGTMYGSAAQSNAVSSTSNVFELYDVGLYLDPEATGVAPPWQMPDEAEELHTCQRYWHKRTGYYCGNSTSGGTYYVTYPFITTMRATPTLTGVNFSASGFPATVGTITVAGSDAAIEGRVCNLTANPALFASTITINARMV